MSDHDTSAPERKCLLGEDCDLTLAWMAGAASQRNRVDAVTAERDAALAQLAEDRDESMWRFWSEKAGTLAKSSAALAARVAALEADRDRLRADVEMAIMSAVNLADDDDEKAYVERTIRAALTPEADR